MTVGFVASVINGWLDGSFGTSFTKLHTADPGAAGTTAAAAGDTTRKANTFASATGGSKALSSNTGPWTNGGTSETISHISIWTASTGGSVIATAALSASQAWANGNTLTLTALTVSITPVAV
jgi:hypothetical protein